MIDVMSIAELKELQAKILFSSTDKVNKITPGSVTNGFIHANAKTAQKILKDIALAQSHFYPSETYGQYLDNIALHHGVGGRLGALPSFVCVRLIAEPNTFYPKNDTKISGVSGVEFVLKQDVTVDQVGYNYGYFESVGVGGLTNVESLTLNKLTPQPQGHKFAINEYQATGGRDIEGDDEFRYRIQNSFNIASTGTLSKLEQVFRLSNSNVLRLFNYGSNQNGKIKIGVLSQNGSYFTEQEFNNMLSGYRSFLSMSEINTEFNTEVAVQLVNVLWQPVDISFRCQIETGADLQAIRTEAQFRASKYLDFRFWKPTQKVEWDDLLGLMKKIPKILYIPDTTFVPNVDVGVQYGKLPRIRGFQIRDLEGNILTDSNNILQPIFFPKETDFYYNKLILRNL